MGQLDLPDHLDICGHLDPQSQVDLHFPPKSLNIVIKNAYYCDYGPGGGMYIYP